MMAMEDGHPSLLHGAHAKVTVSIYFWMTLLDLIANPRKQQFMAPSLLIAGPAGNNGGDTGNRLLLSHF